MKFPINRILTLAKDDYEKAWIDTKKYLKLEGNLFNLHKKGKPHPVRQFTCEIRPKMIELGFEELILPIFVDERDVYKEYGPEAALILDRLFYIAELPRPEIGISQKKIRIINQIAPNIKNIDSLASIFRRYKKGTIEADDLIETMIEELKLEETQATAIIDKAFPEFKDLRPIPTTRTLRSHTTALWFLVLAELYKKKPLPLQYFIVGPKWRREQKVDETHLITSNTLSIAILADEISLEDAKRIGKQIAQAIGFENVRVDTKHATSKYYAPQTEFEIFVQHPVTEEWIEIGDGGFYSPVSLAQFGIDKPVINIGFGVERIVMIKTGETDIRKLVYPYYYEDISFTDEEIADLICYEQQPHTDYGRNLVKQFVEKAIEHANDEAPIEIEIFRGKIKNRNVLITIWEKDKGAKLLGKAARNCICVDDGSIVCKSYNSSEHKGIETGLTFLEAIANYTAAKVEELLGKKGPQNWSTRFRMARKASELNLDIDEKVRYFINSNSKKIDLKGPIFIGINVEIR